MKKQGLLILIILCIVITLFIIFTKASNDYNEDEILAIGEDKYLKFLWMVDGAFNESRLEGEFTVNGRKLDKSNMTFSCDYPKKNKVTCVGKNFQEEFNKLFMKSIKYSDVYSDVGTFSWLQYEKGKYYFTNSNNCNIERMSLEQYLTIKEVKDDKIVYRVTFNDNDHKHDYNSDFILIKEDNEWKISNAYYYDLCEMEYHIE